MILTLEQIFHSVPEENTTCCVLFSPKCLSTECYTVNNATKLKWNILLVP